MEVLEFESTFFYTFFSGAPVKIGSGHFEGGVRDGWHQRKQKKVAKTEEKENNFFSTFFAVTEDHQSTPTPP